MEIESIDGNDYLCVLDGMTGARLNKEARVTRGPSTGIAVIVIRRESSRNGGVLFEQVQIADKGCEEVERWAGRRSQQTAEWSE